MKLLAVTPSPRQQVHVCIPPGTHQMALSLRYALCCRELETQWKELQLPFSASSSQQHAVHHHVMAGTGRDMMLLLATRNLSSKQHMHVNIPTRTTHDRKLELGFGSTTAQDHGLR